MLIATIGKVLGSIVNRLLGRGINRFGDCKWVSGEFRPARRAATRYHRYGRSSLLMNWAPIIDDPLTVVSGAPREPLWSLYQLESGQFPTFSELAEARKLDRPLPKSTTSAASAGSDRGRPRWPPFADDAIAAASAWVPRRFGQSTVRNQISRL